MRASRPFDWPGPLLVIVGEHLPILVLQDDAGFRFELSLARRLWRFGKPPIPGVTTFFSPIEGFAGGAIIQQLFCAARLSAHRKSACRGPT